MRKSLLVSVAILLFCGIVSQAAEISGPLRSAMAGLADDGEMLSVLVMHSQQADIAGLNAALKAERATLAERNRQVILALQEAAHQSQPELAAFLDGLQAAGQVKSYRLYWIANLFSVEATRAGLEAIAARPDLAEIYLNYEIKNIEPTSKQSSDLIAGHEIGLTRINAPAAWAQGWTGQGRVVMNIDTGVDGNHAALSARFRGDVDGDGDVDESWFDPYTTHYPTPTDDGSHGTHTMGTICGRTAGGDTIGVAINAKWIAAAAIDRGGGIPRTVADAIASFQWAVDPDANPNTQDNPDAIGNSWGVTTGHGYPPCDETFWVVIDNCEAAGSAVIFSAGNEGPTANSLRRPSDRGTTPYNCFSVGAVDGNNVNLPIASFSSRGPSNCGPNGEQVIKPEVVAPGVSVRSSVPGGGYQSWDGTSMASPHVTGSVAILRQVNPNLDVDAIKEILLQTSTDLGNSGEDNTYGRGIINLDAAVQLAMTGYGYIDGYIRDANNNNPLAGTVQVVNSMRSVQANSSGYYFMALPADTSYTLRASYFGYISQDHNFTSVSGDTSHHNFALSPAPSAILQGTVTSVGGDSISGATVSILGTPVTPVTTNQNGFYQFPSVPSGALYAVGVSVIGYGAGLDSIYIQGGANVLDFTLQPSESFENSDGGYTSSGGWEWGEPTAGPSEAHSGAKLWGTYLNGQYPNNIDITLISPDVMLSDPYCRLEFWHWYASEVGYDGGNVAISNDFGSTWELLQPDHGYPASNITGLDGEPGYDGSSDWTQAGFDLSPYYGQTVRFRWRFGSDGSITDFGWYIDDVTVIGTIPPEPPDLSYNPANFNVFTAPGTQTERNLNILNNGAGPMVYSLTTETFGRTLLNTSSKTAQTKPIGMQPADDKPGAAAEPEYPPMLLGRGGPDVFGHEWIDSDEPGGPALAWVDISGPGTPVTLTDDSFAGPIGIGFDFPYFENAYSTLYIGSNGIVTFGAGSSSYSNSAIPSTGTPNDMIAIWWDDLNPASGGTIKYYFDSANNRFIVSYIGVPNYSLGGNLNFQTVLYPNGRLELNYAAMDPGSDNLTSSTVGIENISGADGLQITYNAAYMHSNLSILIKSGWLSVSPDGGIIPAGGSQAVTVTFDAASLEAGIYNGNIGLNTNDPDTPAADIPVVFNVGSGSAPDIDLSTLAITDTVVEGQTTTAQLTVFNLGNAVLHFGAHDNAAWLTEAPDTGVVDMSSSVVVTLTFDATALTPGTYSGSLAINSDDPVDPLITLPISLLVTGGGSGCQYVVGDINNNGTFNGIDVTYMVGYFKGGALPPYSCECMPGNAWFVAGDVNGNCVFNGIDVTYSVGYFKGGAVPIPCPDCPPSLLVPAVIDASLQSNETAD